MNWRERAGPASFRGVSFFVETTEYAGGRRGVTHEYPGRDTPYREDLGRKARELPVEGYVIGDEYLAAKAAVIAALEEEGPGELIHPYYGTLRVAVTGFRVRESTQEGGLARFSVDFVETPAAPQQPVVVTDATSAASASVVVARASVELEFVGEYEPGVTTDTLVLALGGAVGAVTSAVGAGALDAQQLAALRRQADELRASALTLVRQPEALVAGLLALVGAAPAGILDAYSFSPGERPEPVTGNREKEGVAFDALQHLVQRLVLLRGVELLLEQSFTSYEEALVARASVVELLDEQEELAGDELYRALRQVSVDLAKAVPGEDGDLPRLLRYTPTMTVPSLVLTHRLYGDVARELEVVQRNRVARPGFVAGGVELEVLSDG